MINQLWLLGYQSVTKTNTANSKGKVSCIVLQTCRLSVPQGFSITMSQTPSDCRRKTTVPLPVRLIGLPSGSVPLIVHSVIRRVRSLA